MRPDLMTADAPGTPGADLTTANRAESLRRRLEDLEDAYGPAIRKARQTPGCTDIAVNEDGSIWTTVGGTTAPTGESLTDHAARRIVNLVSDIDNHPIEKAALSANLPTGERFAALLPPTVRRIIFSIRLPPDRVFTLEDYVASGIMIGSQADTLRRAVSERRNILIVGGTGAGKSTLANALLAEPDFQASRTCIIQDQDELKCSGPNVVRAFTGAMTARELVREFLRHNPDRIVIGEIRDGPGMDRGEQYRPSRRPVHRPRQLGRPWPVADFPADRPGRGQRAPCRHRRGGRAGRLHPAGAERFAPAGRDRQAGAARRRAV
jgi:Flp pilus assembly CpaF family ATPase